MTHELLFAFAARLSVRLDPVRAAADAAGRARATSATSGRAISARPTCCGPGARASPRATLLLDSPQGDRGDLHRAAAAVAPAARPIAAAGALIGHLYPVWLRFKGGKGVATLLGVLIALLPVAAAIYAAVWVGLLLTIRISSVAGMAAALSAPDHRRDPRRQASTSRCCSVSLCSWCGSTAPISPG